MRRKLLVGLLVLLLFSAISLVHASDWVSGQVNTAPVAKTYGGGPYFEFGFEVTATNGTLSGNLTCDVPYALVLSQLGSIRLGTDQNVTGDRVINGSLPVGNFLITNFIASGNSSGFSLTDALRWLWTLLGSFN